jgi:hypothetical protein
MGGGSIVRGSRGFHRISSRLAVCCFAAMSVCLSTRTAFADDREITAAELREEIATMEDDFPSAEECENKSVPAERLACKNFLPARQQCEKIKNEIMGQKNDFVVNPILKTDIYDQSVFDEHIGKCKGTKFNVSHDNLYFYRGASYGDFEYVADDDIRVYSGNFFDAKKISTIVFARNYHSESPTEYKQSIFSLLGEKKCDLREIGSVYTDGSLGGSAIVENKVSIINLGGGYYFVEHVRTSDGSRSINVTKMTKSLSSASSPCGFSSKK